MKALSIRQPYANQILYTGKDIENRSWKTELRGFVALHAAGQIAEGFTSDLKDISRRLLGSRREPLLSTTEDAIKASIYLPKGYKNTVTLSAIVGVVEIVDCVEEHASPHFYRSFGDTNFGFVLRNPIPLEKPISVKGRLGFWTVPIEVEKQIRRQLKGHSIEFAE